MAFLNRLGIGESIIIAAIAIQALMELYVWQKKKARSSAKLTD